VTLALRERVEELVRRMDGEEERKRKMEGA